MKRVAVLADIHGNTWALRAVLRDIAERGADLTVNLGDSVWGSLDPAGTVDLLREHGVVSIAGNQDRLLHAPGHSPDHLFLTEALGPDRLRWLASLPPVRDLGDLYLCHATPYADDQYLLETVTDQGVLPASAEEVGARLGGVCDRVVLCGHSHLARVVRLPSGQLVVNPGSVGLPAYEDDRPYPHVMESGTPHARYAMLAETPGGWSAELITVEYPWREAAAVARRNGREDRARWIETGLTSVIRQARPEEAGAITELVMRSKGYWDYDADFLEACRSDLTVTPAYLEAHPVYVQERAGVVVGMYSLLMVGGELTLDLLFVEPAAIGGGVGRRLWEHAVGTARALGHSTLYVVADPNAEAFYRKMGAETIRAVESPVKPGRMLPYMRYHLT